MRKVKLHTVSKKMLADVYTPVGIYLRLRDRFRDTLLLESADHHSAGDSYSFICINAIAGIEVRSQDWMEFKLPGQKPERSAIKTGTSLPGLVWNFMQRFEVSGEDKTTGFAQGLYGYTSYDSVKFFETIQFQPRAEEGTGLPAIRYRLYQYVIAIDHFRDELILCENQVEGVESELQLVESLIRGKDVPTYPFRNHGGEKANCSDEEYREMVRKGISGCRRGDVFQIVLSRRFSQEFTGDEFNVYRALRSINPSPYLFFFDYSDYKLMGSSPEAHLVIRQGKAVLHPIAGTFKRTGDEQMDRVAIEKLVKDPKENAEHVMLVDLARNDLSRICMEVEVSKYKQVQSFSHVIHLVSEVTGKVAPGTNPYSLLAATFPAGTLSGAPKFRAMELIDQYEPGSRGYYGGAIGFLGFNGSCNHAIMIRTFLSRNNTLFFQAGAGIVAASDPENELQEVNNKLQALRKAMELAENI